MHRACQPHSFLQALPDGFECPLFIGKLTGFQLRVEQLSIDLQFEATALRRNELHVFDLLFVGS